MSNNFYQRLVISLNTNNWIMQNWADWKHGIAKEKIFQNDYTPYMCVPASFLITPPLSQSSRPIPDYTTVIPVFPPHSRLITPPFSQSSRPFLNWINASCRNVPVMLYSEYLLLSVPVLLYTEYLLLSVPVLLYTEYLLLSVFAPLQTEFLLLYLILTVHCR